MKKLKFLPTTLMVILCVGVLAIGIYAITPSKNTIDGTITINASPAEVKLECFIGEADENPDMTFDSVRTGKTWTPAFEMGTGSANTVAEIPEYVLTIKVTNKSDKELGVYFFETGTEAQLSDGYATGANIRTTGALKKSDMVDEDGNPVEYNGENTNLVNVNFDVYKYLAPKDDASGNVIEMKITFKCADFMDACKLAFNYKLNIEEYVSNVSSEQQEGKIQLTASDWKVEGEYEDSKAVLNTDGAGTKNAPEFVKLDKDVTSILGATYVYDVDREQYYITENPDFYNNSTIKYVVGTNKLTIIGKNTPNEEYYEYIHYGPFQNCTALEWVSFPNITKLGDNVFNGCTNLKKYQFGRVTELGISIFQNCTSLTYVDFNQFSYIAGYMFYDCIGITGLNIPENITIGSVITEYSEGEGSDYIYGYSFKGCTGITSIKIPVGVTIMEYSFSDCSLDSLTLTDLPTITYKSFANLSVTNVIAKITQDDYHFVNGRLDVINATNSIFIPNNYAIIGLCKSIYLSNKIKEISGNLDTVNVATVDFLSISSSVTKIYFGGFKSINEVEIPSQEGYGWYFNDSDNAYKESTYIDFASDHTALISVLVYYDEAVSHYSYDLHNIEEYTEKYNQYLEENS